MLITEKSNASCVYTSRGSAQSEEPITTVVSAGKTATFLEKSLVRNRYTSTPRRQRSTRPQARVAMK